MSKTKKSLLIPLLGLILTGCKGAVNEVYDQGQFHTNDFTLNYYTDFPDELKADKYSDSETVFTLNENQFYQSSVFNKAFDDAIFKDFSKGYITKQQMIDLYGDDNVKAIKEENYASEIGYFEAFIEAMKNSTKATWFNYAKEHKLSSQHQNDERINSYFKHGMFSKLTEGLLACDGSGSLVRVQIKEQGFGKQFDYEITDYHALTLSLRGGSNIPYFEIGQARVTSVSVVLKLSFYIEETISNDASKVTLNIPIENLVSDESLQTNIIHLYFSDIFAQDSDIIKRSNAMSIEFELVEHDIIKPNGVDNPNNDYEFSVMMYEVMLPYSSWN